MLLKSYLLTGQQLDAALAEQMESRKRLGEILVDRGWLFPQDIARALAHQHGIKYVDIQRVSVDPGAAAPLDPEIGQRYSSIPVRFLTDGTLLIAVADPTSPGLAAVTAAVGGRLAFAVAEEADIVNAWRLLLSGYVS
ncbi:MAG: hypothetical protein H0V45_15615 [Actinobacteria bacterium]|nr:hypothetical protein [Actinomycetota bacterium]